jgi:DNA-binding CsgD family transcriptional regulator
VGLAIADAGETKAVMPVTISAAALAATQTSAGETATAQPQSRAGLLLAQWSRGIGEIMQVLQRPEFEATLLQAVCRLAEVDFVMAFAYHGNQRPAALGDTLDSVRRRVIVADYLNGPYMLDPFFQAIQDGTNYGCFRLRNLAPDRFRQSEYFRAHYQRTGIGEEIGFFCDIGDDVTAVLSLAKWADSPPASRQDLALLSGLSPAICALCAQHWQGAARMLIKDRRRKPGSPQMEAAYEQFGHRLLSVRERQIVTLVLQGHSTDSAARLLDISPGTVKIHRRNIYRKLGISTQAELFAAFLDFVG